MTGDNGCENGLTISVIICNMGYKIVGWLLVERAHAVAGAVAPYFVERLVTISVFFFFLLSYFFGINTWYAKFVILSLM